MIKSVLLLQVLTLTAGGRQIPHMDVGGKTPLLFIPEGIGRILKSQTKL